MKKIILTILILFTLISTCIAYTVEVTTYKGTDIYKNVASYKFDNEFLILYVWDSFKNYKVLIKKINIISVKVEN